MTSFYTVCPKCKAVVYVKCGIIKCPCGYKQKSGVSLLKNAK